jgi:hypothetical protein
MVFHLFSELTVYRSTKPMVFDSIIPCRNHSHWQFKFVFCTSMAAVSFVIMIMLRYLYILCLLLEIKWTFCYDYISSSNFKYKYEDSPHEKHKLNRQRNRLDVKRKLHRIRPEYEIVDDREPLAQIDIASFIRKPDEYPIEDNLSYELDNRKRCKFFLYPMSRLDY